MGVLMCSTGQHILFISVTPMQSFPKCACPPWELPPKRSNVTPRVNNPAPGYDFITKQRIRAK